MPTYLFTDSAMEVARCNMNLIAESHSSKSLANNFILESRSGPSVGYVRSFEPIEKPSKYCGDYSAKIALDGTSHIMVKRRPFSPRLKPYLADSSTTFSV